MPADRTLAEGLVRLYRLDETAEADRSAQVATGIDPTTGEVVVFVRLGRLVSAISPQGAAELADGLKAEAAYALVQSTAGDAAFRGSGRD